MKHRKKKKKIYKDATREKYPSERLRLPIAQNYMHVYSHSGYIHSLLTTCNDAHDTRSFFDNNTR